jgi:hypothetical protein
MPRSSSTSKDWLKATRAAKDVDEFLGALVIGRQVQKRQRDEKRERLEL